MKKLYTVSFLSILIFVLGPGYISAQNFKLVDINKTRNSNPTNYQFAQKSTFALLNGIFYFAADDGIHGSELFASDGTTKGTTLVKDIFKGEGSSNIFDIITSGNKIYFVASDTVNKQKIWLSDGTGEGTKPLSNQEQALNNSNLLFLTDVNGTVFFSYNYTDYNFTNQGGIWKTDSTGTGIIKVSDLNGFVDQIMSLNGRLFFTAYDYNSQFGDELYTSDGTTAGTKIVADINPAAFTGSNPSNLTPLNGLLYFAADDGNGIKLWVSDGSAAGTHAIIDNQNIYLVRGASFGSDPFAVKGNTLFFQGSVSTGTGLSPTGVELCSYNSSKPADGVKVVKDVVPGSAGSSPSYITTVNKVVFFVTKPDSADAQLWKSDGTNKGTVLVKYINPGGYNHYSGLTNVHGSLLFSYSSNLLGTELWKCDGTAAGTAQLKEIYPGAPGSLPWYFTNRNEISLFSANSPKGVELWKTDGTAGGTVLVKDINYKTTSSSYPFGFVTLKNDKVVFIADNGKLPGSLYVSDGTGAGTKPLDSFALFRRMFNTPDQFAIYKNEACFVGYPHLIYATNGTKNGTHPLAIPDVISPDSGYITNLVATQKFLYILTFNYRTNVAALWRTDGSEAETIQLKSDINANFQSLPTVVGNDLYFATFEPNAGGELWKTDGTPGGTKLVKVVGGYNYNPLSFLYNFKGTLYFDAYTPNNSLGPVLWKSDGTEEGTKIVKDLVLFQQPFAQANGKLFFYALDPLTMSYELFKSNGTSAGTTLVKDINKGDGSSNAYLYPSALISGDSLLYFIANDGIHGAELWKSNGTSAGTKRLKDITVGVDGTSFGEAVNIHDHLFFTANNVLWQSDGTKENTHRVNDENLQGLSQIANLAAAGDSLYFSAYTYATGNELYVGSAAIDLPVVTAALTDGVSNYVAPATVSIKAVVTNDVATIARVQFYNGNTLLHSEFKSPYTFTWTGVSAGNYVISARATDNSGNVGTSAPIYLSVNNTTAGRFASNVLPGGSLASAINLSPDPATNVLQISVAGLPSGKPFLLSVLSTNGVTVKSMRSIISKQAFPLDISALAAGVYVVKILCGGTVMHKQFVKLYQR